MDEKNSEKIDGWRETVKKDKKKREKNREKMNGRRKRTERKEKPKKKMDDFFSRKPCVF